MSTEELSFSVASILGNDSGPRKHSTESINPRHFSASSTESFEESLYTGSESRLQERSHSITSCPTPGIPFTMKDFSLGDEDTSSKRDDNGHNHSGSNADKLTTRSRRARMRFTPKQIQMLEQQFREQHYLLPADRKILAIALRMTERQVKTWFQNKRAQYKRTRPLIRNPIYHNFRVALGRQTAPFYSGAAISHLTFADISNMCTHAYPTYTSPLFVPPVIVHHPPTSVARPKSR